MNVKMVLESKPCFPLPVIEILRKYPIFCCLPIFTYLKSIAETLPFYQCRPAFSIFECHFTIADWFKVVVVTWPPTANSLLPPIRNIFDWLSLLLPCTAWHVILWIPERRAFLGKCNGLTWPLSVPSTNQCKIGVGLKKEDGSKWANYLWRYAS